MNMSELFALLIVDSVISFFTACTGFAITLLCAAIIGNPRPLYWAWISGAAFFVAVFFVLLLMQGAHSMETQ